MCDAGTFDSLGHTCDYRKMIISKRAFIYPITLEYNVPALVAVLAANTHITIFASFQLVCKLRPKNM
jgi:hypothetical protein